MKRFRLFFLLIFLFPLSLVAGTWEETLSKAQHGDATAQFYVGVRYAKGIGVPKDEGEAVAWYRKAAHQGHADAQYNLGVRYGGFTAVTIVQEDHKKAYVWLHLAAEKGHEGAKKVLASLTASMTPAQIMEAQRTGISDGILTPSPLPVATWRTFPPTGSIRTVFKLDASGSRDQEEQGGTLQIRWDWENDGVWDTPYSTIKQAFHSFESEGIHFVTLQVKNRSGMTTTKSLPLAVGSLDFMDVGDGTIANPVNGLIWLKNAHCFTQKKWAEATAAVARLAQGRCGLTDDSAAGHWRLPTITEWVRFADARSKRHASHATDAHTKPENDLFHGVQTNIYWSSTSRADDPLGAWRMDLNDSNVDVTPKNLFLHVWPVRDGK